MLNVNIPPRSRVRETRKGTVEAISKQLEYVTKGHIRSNANNKFLVPFSSVLELILKTLLLITRSSLSAAQASRLFSRSAPLVNGSIRVRLRQSRPSSKLKPSVLTTAVLNDFYNEVTAYTALAYSVLMARMDAKVTPTDDTDYSCHSYKAIELI